jgi:hypothetical protein
MMPITASDVPGVLQGQRQRNRPSDQVRYDLDNKIWYQLVSISKCLTVSLSALQFHLLTKHGVA